MTVTSRLSSGVDAAAALRASSSLAASASTPGAAEMATVLLFSSTMIVTPSGRAPNMARNSCAARTASRSRS